MKRLLNMRFKDLILPRAISVECNISRNDGSLQLIQAFDQFELLSLLIMLAPNIADALGPFLGQSSYDAAVLHANPGQNFAAKVEISEEIRLDCKLLPKW